MQFNCPACSNAFLITPEHLGQAVECPHCHKAVAIPASPAPIPAPIAEPTKRCPFCGETILKVARRCKFCKADIPEGLDSDSAADRLLAKEPLIAQQASAAPQKLPYAVRGRFQWSTIVLAALTLVCAIGAAIGLSAGERSPTFGLGIMGTIFGSILLICALFLGLRDLFAVKYLGRHTPEKGAKAFLGGLCNKRYRFAYYCVLDADKDQMQRLRPPLPKFGVDTGLCSFDQYAGFRDYWKNLIHKDGTSATLKSVRLERVDGDLAEVSATIKLTKHSTTGFLALGALGAALFATRESLPVKKLFRCVNGQWYAVNGELHSGEDRFGFDCRIVEPVEVIPPGGAVA